MNKFRRDLAFCFHMAPGKISPARILSTVTEMVTWLGLCARFLPGTAGFNFKILLRSAFCLLHPVTFCAGQCRAVLQAGLRWDRESQWSTFFFFFWRTWQGSLDMLLGTGRGGGGGFGVQIQGKGTSRHCYLQGWPITLMIAGILHDSLV